MARRVFHSFHYQLDSHRVQRIKQIGAVEGQRLLSSNEWEQVKARGNTAIQAWIDEHMKGTSCLICLVGAQTAGRKWVEYEIIKAWNEKKGVMGIYIHNLVDLNGRITHKGANPFERIKFDDGTPMSRSVPVHDPAGFNSIEVYNTIRNNIEQWVESAIATRN